LNQEGDVLEERMNECIECALFNQEKLKLLVQLFVDFTKLCVEDVDSLSRDYIVVHENGG